MRAGSEGNNTGLMKKRLPLSVCLALWVLLSSCAGERPVTTTPGLRTVTATDWERPSPAPGWAEKTPEPDKRYIYFSN